MSKSKQLMKRVVGSLKVINKRKYIKIFVTAIMMTAMIGGTIIDSQAVYTIKVNGQEVGFVSSKEELDTLMDTVDEELDEIFQEDYDAGVSLEQVQVTKSLITETEDDDEVIKEAIISSVDGVSKLYTVYVDGAPAGAVEEESAAQGILEGIKEKYTVANAETVEFVQNVEIVNECVNEEKLSMDEAGLAKLLDPENSESEFSLSVRCTDTVEYAQDIRFETQTSEDSSMYEGNTAIVVEGKNGLENVTAERIFINGEESQEIPLSRTVITEPVTEFVSVGTAERPVTASYGEYIWPTDGIVTSYFGYRNVSVGSSNHKGIDIGGSYGQDIVAADGGEVILAEWYSGYGNYIQIRHDDGTVTAYGHCSEMYVTAGDLVFRGQPIAAMGETGVASGVHLHFEVIVDGEHIDPLNFLP